MAKLYKTVTVHGSPGTEVVKTLITSTPEEPVRVLSVVCYETTATRQGDAILRFYIEREKIAEVPVKIWQGDLTNKTYIALPRLELSHVIEVGQSLIVGVVSGSNASDFEFVIEYEIQS